MSSKMSLCLVRSISLAMRAGCFWTVILSFIHSVTQGVIPWHRRKAVLDATSIMFVFYNVVGCTLSGTYALSVTYMTTIYVAGYIYVGATYLLCYLLVRIKDYFDTAEGITIIEWERYYSCLKIILALVIHAASFITDMAGALS